MTMDKSSRQEIKDWLLLLPAAISTVMAIIVEIPYQIIRAVRELLWWTAESLLNL